MEVQGVPQSNRPRYFRYVDTCTSEGLDGVAVRRLEKLCKIQNTDVLFMGGIESVIGKIFTTDPVKGEAQLC